MTKLPKPFIDPEKVYTKCTKSIRDPEVRTELLRLTQPVVRLLENYDQYAANGHLWELDEPIEIQAFPYRKQLRENYTYRMVHKSSVGRHVYDEIINSAPNQICPYCDHREVKTLDHFLPKSDYPALSVNPHNLIPCCSDCNRAKNSIRPSSFQEQVFHPYYDKTIQKEWFYCELHEEVPCSYSFYVNDQNISPIWFEKLNSHFKYFSLNSLFISQAGSEMRVLLVRLKNLLNSPNTARLVRDYLMEEYEIRKKGGMNSWQTALYRALAHSDWFISYWNDNIF